MATADSHPGNDYYVQVSLGLIQRQSNSVLADGLRLAGYLGPMTYAQAQGHLDLNKKVEQSGKAPITGTAGEAAKGQTGSLPNPFAGLNEIAAVLDAAYHQLTKISFWRSLGWIVLGLLMTGGGIAWWAKSEESDIAASLTGLAGGKKTGKAPVIPLLLISIGIYLVWFGVKFWENLQVIWPSDPIKAVLQGKGMPAGAKDTTATAYLTAAESSIQSGGTVPDVSASTGGSYPNHSVIMSYLVAQGYSPTAAAGIYGNVYQESGGNPEAGGSGNAGLIQWTPGSAAGPDQPIMTGNASKDLGTQLVDIMQWAQDNNATPDVMNQASTPQDAATLWMNNAERPGIPALANRQSAAVNVYDEYQKRSGGLWKPLLS